MKFLVISLSLYTTCIKAGPAEIKDAMLKIYENMFFTDSQASEPSFRGLNNTMADVGGYGCWCYIDYTHGKGKGTPVDELDIACKTLHHNYECLILETESMVGNACQSDPWNVSYRSMKKIGFKR